MTLNTCQNRAKIIAFDFVYKLRPVSREKKKNVVKFSNFIIMSSTEEQSGPDPENCFKILLATDIHLGYKEKDEIIGKFLNICSENFSEM